MSDYSSVKVPKELIKQVEKIVGTHGYKSIMEFVKDSIRRRLDSIRLIEPIEQEQVVQASWL